MRKATLFCAATEIDERASESNQSPATNMARETAGHTYNINITCVDSCEHFKVALGVLTDKQGVEIYFFKCETNGRKTIETNMLKATTDNSTLKLNMRKCKRLNWEPI